MELNYHHPTHTHELTIISDSRSVLQSIESPQKMKHPVINTILTTADTLKAAGTKVNLYWIPSHVGIPGNEMADQLASEESDRRLASRVQQNQLTSAEQAAVFKEYLREKNIKDLHEGKYKDNTNTKTRSGMQKWHIHKSRHITKSALQAKNWT
jgi:hypothetical protein